MLWGQQITLYTDALGLTSDQVYCWRLLLKEYGPTIVYIKDIHNTVAAPFHGWSMDPSQMTGRTV
ncbi:hypothetical protein ACHAW6_000536 [Cyclotella cf. meneghiniana]